MMLSGPAMSGRSKRKLFHKEEELQAKQGDKAGKGNDISS